MVQDSFAIYASNKCETDIHINVWTNIKSINYIDIGLRIYRRKQFRTISIYIPFHISQSEIWDLSEILKDESVMRGIFNEKCSISISSTKEYYDVKLNKCSMRVLSINSCLINIDKLENGTIITFFISQWSKNNIAYIRFRLPYKSLSYYLLSKKHIYLEALESPIIKEKYFYNFKLNEGRTLPKQILSNINDLVVTRKINFFCAYLINILLRMKKFIK